MRSTSTRSSTRLTRAALQALCALLLLAQHVGLAHAVWHAAEHLPAHEQPSHAHGEGERSSPAETSKLCALDAAFGQVLGAGPLSCLDFRTESPSAAAPAHAHGVHVSLSALTPRSRGPPSPL